jgi:hypothetical protein
VPFENGKLRNDAFAAAERPARKSCKPLPTTPWGRKIVKQSRHRAGFRRLLRRNVTPQRMQLTLRGHDICV